MRFGKVCKKHPELNGRRYDDYHCCGCSKKSTVRWKKANKSYYNAAVLGPSVKKYQAKNASAIRMYIHLKYLVKKDGLWS